MDQGVRDQIKAQYPTDKLYELSIPDEDITLVVRGAEYATWLKYRSMSMDIGDTVKRAQASEFLLEAMVVWPDRETLRKTLVEKRKAGIYQTLQPKLAEICGVRERVEVGEF